jgi:hypothetical protein
MGKNRSARSFKGKINMSQNKKRIMVFFDFYTNHFTKGAMVDVAFVRTSLLMEIHSIYRVRIHLDL